MFIWEKNENSYIEYVKYKETVDFSEAQIYNNMNLFAGFDF